MHQQPGNDPRPRADQSASTSTNLSDVFMPRASDQVLLSAGESVIQNELQRTYGGITLGEIFAAAFKEGPSFTIGSGSHPFLELISRLPGAREAFLSCGYEDLDHLDRGNDSLMMRMGLASRFSPQAEDVYRTLEKGIRTAAADMAELGLMKIGKEYGEIWETTLLGRHVLGRIA